MSTILSFRDLEVWQFGMEIVVRIYRATEAFPTHERYGLTSQMRRAAVSMPSNIAEGHARGEGAYLNHVRIALGSQAELGTEIEAASRLGFLDAKSAASLLRDIERLRQMLYALRRSLERRRRASVSFGFVVFLYLAAPLT
jgi:four helix bundle protein